MKKEVVKTTEKQPEKKKYGFQKGDPRINRNGRPQGHRDFNTDFDEAVDDIAKEEGITRSEARKALFKVAYHQAKAGNYNFYKDVTDRRYGTAVNKTELVVEMDPESKEKAKKAVSEYLKNE